MHYGSIRDLLDKKSDNLPWSMRLKFAKEAAKGMLVLYYYILLFIYLIFILKRAYLHSKKLIHRDLKPENLLVNKYWVCKIADFGISTVVPKNTRDMTCIGTPRKYLLKFFHFYLYL